MPAKNDQPKEGKSWQYEPNPLVNKVMTVIFWMACAVGVYSMSSDLPLLAKCFVGVAVAVEMTKFVFSWLATTLSSTLLKNAPFGDPMKKAKTRSKFTAQSWQLVIHCSLAYLEYLAMPTNMLYEPHRAFLDIENLSPEIRFVYYMQMAIWIYTCFMHVYVEEKHSDYFVMYGHHVVTILLVGLSYQFHFAKIGLLVLFLHDISDVPIDVLKMVNYLKLQDASGLFLSEIVFVGNLISWAYVRLYVYPVYVIYHGTFTALAGLTNLDGSRPYVWREIQAVIERGGQLSTESKQQIFLLHAWGLLANILLIILALMHIYWYALFLRILYKLMNGVTAHDTGRQEYEGSSDDEVTPPVKETEKGSHAKRRHKKTQ